MPGCRSRSRAIIRRPAAPAATATRRSRICSGARRISSRARQRHLSEVEPARLPGERQRLESLGALVETAGCRAPPAAQAFRRGAARDLRQLRQLPGRRRGERRRDRAGAQIPVGGVPHRADVRRRLYRAGADRPVGRAQLMNGHEALSVWGIVGAEEAALLKPLGRALVTRDALRANDHGGLEFGPGARAILKGEETVALLATAQARAPPARRSRRRRQPGRQSAVRGAAHTPPRAGAGGRRAALCHLPRFGAARDGGVAAQCRARRWRCCRASARASSTPMATRSWR